MDIAHLGDLITRSEVEDARLEAKDCPTEDRPSRGQGQECSISRTQAQVLSKQKKKSSEKNFRRSPEKNVFPKNFLGAPQTFNNKN